MRGVSHTAGAATREEPGPWQTRGRAEVTPRPIAEENMYVLLPAAGQLPLTGSGGLQTVSPALSTPGVGTSVGEATRLVRGRAQHVAVHGRSCNAIGQRVCGERREGRQVCGSVYVARSADTRRALGPAANLGARSGMPTNGDIQLEGMSAGEALQQMTVLVSSYMDTLQGIQGQLVSNDR